MNKKGKGRPAAKREQRRTCVGIASHTNAVYTNKAPELKVRAPGLHYGFAMEYRPFMRVGYAMGARRVTALRRAVHRIVSRQGQN